MECLTNAYYMSARVAEGNSVIFSYTINVCSYSHNCVSINEIKHIWIRRSLIYFSRYKVRSFVNSTIFIGWTNGHVVNKMLNHRTIPRQIELKWILRKSKPKLWLIVHRWLKNRVHPMSHYSAERRKAPNHIIEMPKRMPGSAWQKFNFFCRVRIDSKFSQFSFFSIVSYWFSCSQEYAKKYCVGKYCELEAEYTSMRSQTR